MGGLLSTNDDTNRSTTTTTSAATSRNYSCSHRVESFNDYRSRSGQPEESRYGTLQSSRYRQPTESQYTTARKSSGYYNSNEEAIDIFSEQLRKLTIRGGTIRQISKPERSIRNPQLFGIDSNLVVRNIQLSEYDDEYMQINRMITNKRLFKVDNIIKIENPYLENAYELKKQQKRQQYGNVEERLLFHGTKQINLNSILQNNFNWRLCKTHLFGKGVSFSPKATYAANYSDEQVYQKVMIVAKVLICRSCIGNKFMELPVEGCDTSQKGTDGIVIVKYEDNEFYPAYKILYHLEKEHVRKRSNGRNRRGGRQQPVYFDHFDDSDYFDDDSY